MQHNRYTTLSSRDPEADTVSAQIMILRWRAALGDLQSRMPLGMGYGVLLCEVGLDSFFGLVQDVNVLALPAGQQMDVLFLHILANNQKEVQIGFRNKDVRGSPGIS